MKAETRRWAVAVTVAVASLLAGCGPRPTAAPPSLGATPASPRPTPAASGVIAWLDQPASAPPPPTVPGARPKARPCGPSDLPASAQVEGTSAAMTHRDTRVTVRNVGRTPCSLIGTPSLTYRDAAGHLTAVPTLEAPILGDPGIVGYATMDPGEPAWLIIEESDGCNGGSDPARYASVSIDVDGTPVALPGASFSTTCPIRVSTWYRPAEADYRPPNRFDLVRVELQVPDTVRRGTDLVFTVSLFRYGDPVPLEPCPVYTETLGSLAFTYRLNCASPTLAAGTTRFAMRLAVPAEMATGPSTLDWHFDEPGVRVNAGNGETVTVV